MRFLQRVQRKRGKLDYERAVVDPLDAARRAVLGAAAQAPAALPIRVDEFPHYLAWDDPERYGTERYRRFHVLMAGAGVPYLIAVLPRVSHDALNPDESSWRALSDDERALLAELPADRVAFGLHGLDHRTRFASPRRHSELCGLDRAATEALLDQGFAELAPLGIAPEVFVAPSTASTPRSTTSSRAASRSSPGGPSRWGCGFPRTPRVARRGLYRPLPPLYGRAREVLPAAQRSSSGARACGRRSSCTGAGRPTGLAGARAPAGGGRPYAADWEDFLAAVRASDSGGARES